MKHVLFGALPPWVDVILRVVLAGICGFGIGFERKMRSKEAGIRTHTIVAMGSCLMMILSKYGFGDVQSTGDAARIVAQVVSGIGFLGGGIIVYTKGSLHGLTTAAGVWTTAGVGMAVGTGLTPMIILAGVVTLLVICTHLLFRLPITLFRTRTYHTVVVKFKAEEGAIDKIKGIFKSCTVEKMNLSRVVGEAELEGKVVFRTADNIDDNAWKKTLEDMPFIKFIEYNEEEI
ncbi:MAG: MgtC/SapB family protein [Clostridia bacterium]|nr:MgtC/SapB family protein [Clostridia bacterium]